jgi:hypothetical protein
MTIWCMRSACWLHKAKDTRSEYAIIIIALSLQQWLHERASNLTQHVHCLVTLHIFLDV